MKIPATIAAIRQEAPRIKSFRLDLGSPDFSFLPGQWIECYVSIQGRPEVAGYSITSSPLSEGTIELAVKRAGSNTVTHFLHEHARVGDILRVDGGHGDFYYRREMGDSLVLIGGGIGIAPLMSIIRYVHEAEPDVRVTLLYSTRNSSELVFRNELEEISARNMRIRCMFTVTQPRDERWNGHVGRIDAEMLTEAQLDTSTLYFVCGPRPMLKNILALLDRLGILASRIKYEQW